MEYFDDKQPSEEYYLGFGFIKDLGDDEDVASATFVVLDTDDDDKDVTDTLLDSANQVNSGKWAYCWIQGGTDGHRYKITCLATGNGDPAGVYEMEAYIRVREK